MIPFLFGFALACFMWGGVFLWLDHRRRRVTGITKFARMTRAENPVEIASATEIKRRMYRDGLVEVPPPWEREEGGIDYRFINLTGLEKD